MSEHRTPDKLTAELPKIRVSEQMEIDIMRAAAADERSVSDLVRVILAAWLYGHARKLPDADGP
jgi:hypothetical protein